jgi:hypothetical protein
VLEAETALQAYNEVLQALACNHISNRRAALLLHGIQLANARSGDVPCEIFTPEVAQDQPDDRPALAEDPIPGSRFDASPKKSVPPVNLRATLTGV